MQFHGTIQLLARFQYLTWRATRWEKILCDDRKLRRVVVFVSPCPGGRGLILLITSLLMSLYYGLWPHTTLSIVGRGINPFFSTNVSSRVPTGSVALPRLLRSKMGGGPSRPEKLGKSSESADRRSKIQDIFFPFFFCVSVVFLAKRRCAGVGQVALGGRAEGLAPGPAPWASVTRTSILAAHFRRSRDADGTGTCPPALRDTTCP